MQRSYREGVLRRRSMPVWCCGSTHNLSRNLFPACSPLARAIHAIRCRSGRSSSLSHEPHGAVR
jgi:hypothetical protein